MKIIYVSREYPPATWSYGIGTYVKEAASALAALGHDVTVVTLAASDASGYIEQDGVKVIAIANRGCAAGSTALSRRWYAHLAERDYRREVANVVQSLVAKHCPDVIEFQGFGGESAYVDYEQIRAVKCKVVVRFHGWTGWVHRRIGDFFIPDKIIRKRWETRELMAADKVSCVGKHLVPHLAQRIDVSRIAIVVNGLDGARWGESVPEPSPQIAEFGPYVLFVGSLTHVKGAMDLVTAFELRSANAYRLKTLVMVGRISEDFRLYLERKFPQGPPAWLRLLGHRSRVELPPLVRNAAVCCLPSRTEPFNYTCLEAMATGTVVIGTRGTGMAEMLDGFEGILIESGSPVAIGKALEYVAMLSEEERLDLSRQLKARFATRYSQKVFASNLESLYMTLGDHQV
jgi:glycosyltransferase involved in cell wall biosynthesis